MDVIRFRLPPDLDGPEKSKAAHSLQSVDGVVLRAPTDGPAMGAGSIDPGVLVALIEGGATLVAPVIAAFAMHFLSRPSRKGAVSSLRIAVRGSDSSVEIGFDKGTRPEDLEARISHVGSVLEVEAMYGS